MQKNLDEQFRMKVLEHGPVGIWQTVPEYETPVYGYELSFFPERTGLLRQVGFGGQDDVTFHWDMPEFGVLRIKEDLDPEVDEEDDNDNDNNEDNGWTKIRLEFRREKTLVGEWDVLSQVGQSAFWWLISPVAWICPIEI